MIKLGDYDKAHRKRLLLIGKEVERIIARYTEEMGKLALYLPASATEDFALSNSIIAKTQAERIFRRLSARLHSHVLNSIKKEFDRSWQKNNEIDVLYRQQRASQQARDEALKRFIERKTNGLTLSERIWRYSSDARSLVEAELERAVRLGIGANALAPRLRNALENPDVAVGAGKYRKPLANCKRLATTEINIAYRTADMERWEHSDYVLGYRVETSGTNPRICEACLALQGDYPKTFKWVGWHPQCRCHAIPILEPLDSYLKRLDSGEPAPQPISKLPESYSKYISSKTNGNPDPSKLSFFLRGAKHSPSAPSALLATKPSPTTYLNALRYIPPTPDKYISDHSHPHLKSIAERSRIRHASRTPEQIEHIRSCWQKKLERDRATKAFASAVLKSAKDVAEVDFSTLEALVAKNNLTQMGAEARRVEKLVNAMRAEEQALADLIPNVHQWHKKCSLAELKKTYSEIEKIFARWEWDYSSEASLSFLQNKLKAEISFASNSAHKTKEIAIEAFRKRLELVEEKQAWLSIKSQYKALASFSTKSKVYKDLLAEAKQAIQEGNKTKASSALDKVYEKKLSLSKSKGSAVNTKIQTSHPKKLDGDEAIINQIMEMTGVGSKRAVEFFNAAYGFSYQWDFEIRSVQCGNFNFTSRHGHSLSEIMKKAVDLEEFIKASPQWRRETTYRGITLSKKELKETMDKLKEGTFHNFGSASWSTDKSVAQKFSGWHLYETSEVFGDEKTIKVVLISKGHHSATSIYHLSYFSTEYEVLASKECRYKYVKHEMKNGIVYIEVEPK